jgi:hypothetical protein
MRIIHSLLAVVMLSAPAWVEAASLRRFAVVVGANTGGGRPALRYAVTDASRFADVLRDLGGVHAKDATVLSQPTVAALETAVRSLRNQVEQARKESGRIEVVFYYSGHADETGLLLGADRYSYESLRDGLSAVSADVRIAVLDACASGAMTRLKGGEPRRPFMVDASSNMRGHAFLTSSSADESAQESDRIGGSFFTHFLVSGLRGAADTSGEGKVTLNEAYQYAFNETLGRTLKTQGGPQHPSYDVDLSGTGDVVITDLRETNSSLVLDADISGRCYVRDQKAGILIEVEKPLGKRIELGVGPGRYEVHCQDGSRARSSQFSSADGASRILNQDDFKDAKLDPTLRRGGKDDAPLLMGMQGVHRVSFEGGIVGHRSAFRHSFVTESFSTSTRTGATPVERIDGRSQSGLTTNFALRHWIRPRLGLELRGHTIEEHRQGSSGVASHWTDETFVTGVLAGGRFELNGSSKVSAARPFLHASIGPYFRPAVTLPIDPKGVADKSGSVLWGASFGAGIDLRFGSHLGLGLRSSYDLLPDYKDAAGTRFDYRGVRFTLATSWFFGGGRSKK